MGKSLTVLFLAFLCSVGDAVANDREKEIEKLMKEMNIPGVQVVHVKDGNTVSYNIGKKRYGSDDRVDENTIFQAASMTKTVAAYAMLRLYDKGVYDLDKPLVEYMPYERLAHDPNLPYITARMCLNHTSGLPNWARGNPLKTNFKPGTGYRYSGEGFMFLQRVLEHLTGKSFAQIAKEEVFEPLGMKHSSLIYESWMEAHYAVGHDGGAGLVPSPLRKFKTANSAASLLTTATDYTIFVQEALLKGKGLKPETLEMMLTTSSSAKPRDKSGQKYKHVSYGLGIVLQENELGKAIAHTGSNRGRYLTVFIAHPDTKESLVVFTNSVNGDKFRSKVAEMMLPQQTLWLFRR